MHQEQVWIVDDEEELAASYAEFLEDRYEPRIFHSAAEALRKFDQDSASPDLVISDIKMPGMDGISFIQAMRDRGMKKPVVVISGFAEKEDVLRASELKVSKFLEKPLDPQNLRHAVNDAIKTNNYYLLTEQLVFLLRQQALLLESIISKCVERYSHAENLLDEGVNERFADRKSVQAFLNSVYSENKMHRELSSLQEKIADLQKNRILTL